MTDTGNLKITTPTDREIVMTRTFNAPRALVFEAMIQPELLKRWLLGPPGWEMTVCELAPKVGGAYRWAWRHADGQHMTLHGICREFAPPARMVCTQVMEGVPGETLVTSVLAEHAGKTTLSTTVLYPSREARDAALKSGMDRGVEASYNRLAALLAETSAPQRTQAGA
jgi:uncharacterized protein YndB with AHSA1/START domain